MEFGGDGSDFARTRLVAQESADGGLTWSGHRLITETAPGDVNVYSPNLIRAADGGILLYPSTPPRTTGRARRDSPAPPTASC
jgi:sialidase-1